MTTASILIVDDNSENLQILANILRSREYKVAMLKDGEKALRFVDKKVPDLILLDVMMPRIDGFELCCRLKHKEETCDIPIIFISGLTNTHSILKGFEMGCVDYIVKPFHEKEVLARVSAHLHIRNLQKNLQKKNLLLQQEIADRKQTEEALRQAKTSIELVNRNLEKRVQEEVKKRLKQQELLIQKSKLESLGKLAAGIAHEINQPLSGISMGLDNICFKLSSDKFTEAYLQKKIDDFRKDIDRITQIINHVRTFSRDQASVFFENVDVNQVCQNALLMSESQYKHHNVRIHLNAEPDIGFVIGNQYKLEQVILNLITNAKDAVDEKYSSIKESTYQKQIQIKTFCDESRIYIEIEDNGIGISEENLGNIFDPFFTTKPPERGTGLGLSISYGIIQEMNGEISVQSRVNEYTVMRISLPKIV